MSNVITTAATALSPTGLTTAAAVLGAFVPSSEGAASSNPRAAGFVPAKERAPYPKEWLNRTGGDLIIGDGIRTFMVRNGGSIFQRKKGNLYPGASCSQLAGPAVTPANIPAATQYTPSHATNPVAAPTTPTPPVTPTSVPGTGYSAATPGSQKSEGVNPLAILAALLLLG